MAALFEWNFVEVTADDVVGGDGGGHIERVFDGAFDQNRALFAERIFSRAERLPGHLWIPGGGIFRNRDDAAGVKAHSHEHVLPSSFPDHAAKRAAHHD